MDKSIILKFKHPTNRLNGKGETSRKERIEFLKNEKRRFFNELAAWYQRITDLFFGVLAVDEYTPECFEFFVIKGSELADILRSSHLEFTDREAQILLRLWNIADTWSRAEDSDLSFRAFLRLQILAKDFFEIRRDLETKTND